MGALARLYIIRASSLSWRLFISDALSRQKVSLTLSGDGDAPAIHRNSVIFVMVMAERDAVRHARVEPAIRHRRYDAINIDNLARWLRAIAGFAPAASSRRDKSMFLAKTSPLFAILAPLCAPCASGAAGSGCHNHESAHPGAMARRFGEELLGRC
jgi:hypothetical protein